MRARSYVPLFLLIAAAFPLGTGASAQDAIGKATSVRPQAESIRSGNTRELSGGADVYSAETVRTGHAGQADLRFRDNSNLNVGPQSTVRTRQVRLRSEQVCRRGRRAGNPRLIPICDGIAGQRSILSD